MSLAQFLPAPIRQFGRQIKWNKLDSDYRRKTGTADFPPALLRVRVCGSLDIDGYKKGGQASAEAMIGSIERAGIKRDAHIKLFDFGTGCGRILGPMIEMMPNTRFTGSDIWDSAIAYDKKQFKDHNFLVNKFDPPLDLPDNEFDVITAMSVFTHLDEQNQAAWLKELNRVASPGGYLLLSVHGVEHAERTKLKEPYLGQLNSEGFVFVKDGAWSDFMPDGYQTSFQTREWTMKNWSKYVNVVDYYVGGWGHHDIVVIKKD